MWPFKSGARLRDPVADAICDALANDPDSWTTDHHDDLSYEPLRVHLDNSGGRYESLDLKVERDGVRLHLTRSDLARIRQGIGRWQARRRDAAAAALVQDSDTLRVRRIQDFRQAIIREEAALIERKL